MLNTVTITSNERSMPYEMYQSPMVRHNVTCVDNLKK